MKSLIDLDDDILYIVNSALWYSTTSPQSQCQTLLPLSQVCRATRKQTLPWIFRKVRWHVHQREVHPPSLWSYVVFVIVAFAAAVANE